VKRFVFLCACLVAAAGSLSAQAVDATVCDILAHPKSFDGKIVRIKGTVEAGFDEFVIKDGSCRQAVNAIWLAYPAGSKTKAGPAAMVELQLAKNSPGQLSEPARTPVVLDKSKDVKQFDSLLTAPSRTPGRCLACTRSTVTATLTGRLDGVDDPGLVKDASGTFTSIKGFGNLNRYSARLVLQSVADVVPHDIDYSKANALPKSDADPESPDDALTTTHKIAKAFGPTSQFSIQIERAAAAFGTPGKENGVFIAYGGGGNVPKDEGTKANAVSSDGLKYTVILDKDRLKGFSLQEAIVHAGSHIADFREGKFTPNLFQLEAQAWQVAFFSSVAVQDKTLTLPGGYIVWNASWPEADRAKMVSDTLETYLSDWVGLNR
jgi:hypothetical protein